MLAQLAFLVCVFNLVLRPAFAHARMYESGGGARFTLKQRTFARDTLRQYQDVKLLPCWAEVDKIESELNRMLFHHAATRVLSGMLEKNQVSVSTLSLFHLPCDPLASSSQPPCLLLMP